MYRTALILLVAVFGLVGCVAASKNLITPSDGRQVRCGAWGFGFIGTAIAYGTYKDCVNKTEALGFVDLDDFQKSEGPKVAPIPGTSTTTASRPIWDIGTEWTYQLSGAQNGTLRQQVTSKDLIGGVTAYLIQANERIIVLSEDLSTVQIRSNATISESHTPPVENYQWPLAVGKTWKTKGVMETPTGKINTAKTVEVKSYGLVHVPAGEFEAFYLLSTSDVGMRLTELWYAPKLRHHVKLVSYTNAGRIVSELTGSSLIGSPPSDQATVSPSPSSTPTSTSVPQPARVAAPVPSSQPQQQVAGRAPWLGVPLGTPEPQVLSEFGLPAGRGAVVVTFVRDANLPRVDLDAGDIIIAIDGTMVEGPGHVTALLATRNSGSIVRVIVLRRSMGHQTEQPMVILDGAR